MTAEPPVLLPPDDLYVSPDSPGQNITLGQCQLLAHNVAPDGKANPINFDDPRFLFLYRHPDAFIQVTGLNPEMMTAAIIDQSSANDLLERLPYRSP